MQLRSLLIHSTSAPIGDWKCNFSHLKNYIRPTNQPTKQPAINQPTHGPTIPTDWPTNGQTGS